MAVGTFGSIVFTVSDRKILTLRGLQRTAGSTWASHSNLGGKTKTEYMGQELQTISFDMTLSEDLGVDPRKLLEQLVGMAEGKEAFPLIIGGKPVGENPWRLVRTSEDWTRFINGRLVEAKVSVNLEEYL